MKTEKVFAHLFFIILIIRQTHMIFGGMLLSIWAFALFLIYFTGGAYFLREKGDKEQLLYSIIAGMLLATVPPAIQFKLLYWPNGQLYITVACCISICLLITTIILKKNAGVTQNSFFRNMLTRLYLISLVTFILFILPTKTIVKIQYLDNPEYAEIAGDYYAHPENAIYKERYDTYLATYNVYGQKLHQEQN